MLENIFTGNMTDARIRQVERQIQEFVGALAVVDVVNTGGSAHRVRSLWTNMLPSAFLEGCVPQDPQPPPLQGVLSEFHMPSPLYQDDAPPFALVNMRGKPKRVLPTLVSFARNHAFRPRWDGRRGVGELWNCQRGQWEEPNIRERERVMGFVEGDTWALGLSDGAQCELIGRAMDGHMMAWLGGLLGALNRP